MVHTAHTIYFRVAMVLHTIPEWRERKNRAKKESTISFGWKMRQKMTVECSRQRNEPFFHRELTERQRKKEKMERKMIKAKKHRK